MYKHATQGVHDALVRFKVANAPPGILDRLKGFASGQLGHAKDLVGNLRGGFGGAHMPGFAGALNAAEGPINPTAWHREQALGSLKGLAPSLAIAGGGYLLHRHNQAKQEAQANQQRAMMMQQGYGPM